MSLRRLLLTIAITVIVGGVFSGCGTAATNPEGAQQMLTINFSAEPPALDSSIATTNPAFTILNAIHEGLYRLDQEGKPQPGLAKDLPNISPDGLTYTITLRNGLTWADGSPLTAGDFEFAYKRTLDPATKAQYANMIAWIKGGTALMNAKPDEVEARKKEVGVRAVDEKTLEIVLEKPVAFFTSQLAMPLFFPQKSDFVQSQGNKYGGDADKVIGAGPFKLEKWDHEQSLVLVKNDKYWDTESVKLEKVTINIVKDASAGLNAFETGRADLTDLKGDQIKLYQGKPEATEKKELVSSYIMFQTSKMPALQNKKIRQALGMAIDRKAFVDVVLGGVSAPSTGLVPTVMLDGNGQEFRKTAGETQPKYDPTKAKQLLNEGLAELNMASLPKFKLTSDDTDTAKKSIEFIQEQWRKNLGVEIVAEPLPFALRVKKMTERDYEACIALWGADYNDPMNFLDMWTSDNAGFNFVDYTNPTYDDLLRGADHEVDLAKRANMLVEAEKLLMDDMPLAPLYFRTRIYAKQTKVDGLILPSFASEWELKWTSIR